MKVLHKQHRLVFLCFATFLTLSAFMTEPFNLLDWTILAASAILLFGVPHGAFDIAILQQRAAGTSDCSLVLTVIAYAGIAFAVLVLWFATPQMALPAFLAYSALHFSDDWSDDLEGLPRITIGVALLTIPAVFHGEAVEGIFEWIAPSSVAAETVKAMQLIGVVAGQGAIVIVFILAFRYPPAALEIGLILLLAALLPPISYFVVYFCFLHSPRHTIDVYMELRPVSVMEFASRGAPYAVTAVLAVLAGAVISQEADVTRAMLSSVFIALAALTVPHMLIAHGLRKQTFGIEKAI